MSHSNPDKFFHLDRNLRCIEMFKSLIELSFEITKVACTLSPINFKLKRLKTYLLFIYLFPSQKLYEDMRNRIESAMKVGQISEEIRKQHKGFGEWDLVSDPRNHQTILQVLLTVFYALQAYPIILI